MSLAQDYSYIDLPAFRNNFINPEKPGSMKFYVEGVKCGKCVQKIENLETKFLGLKSLRFNMATRQLEVSLDEKEISFSTVVCEVEKLGFTLKPIKTNEDLIKSIRNEDRKDMRRLGVAAVCASNIMMFSFAVYFGADGYMASFFEWLGFAFYLPVLTYVAVPFYKGFIQAIKDKTLSVDGPMAIASVSGFIFSTINLLRGEGSIYFDSLAGFLFLILLSRFLQKRLQRNFLSFQNSIPIDFMTRARKVSSPGHYEWAPTETLQPGDEVLVYKSEVIPVDGLLKSESIHLDSSYLTGESHAVYKNKSMSVEAGTILLSDEARLSVTNVNEKTQFGSLLRQVQNNSLQKSQLQNVSDRWSQVLLVVVFSVALIYLAFMWSTSPVQALERSLALIILACPCAMAFGTPLALAFSIKKSFEKGFLVKNGDVFEKLLKVENIFFDKTGTLTGRKLRIKEVVGDPSAEDLSLVLGLQNVSQHPIADAIRNWIGPKQISSLSLDSAKEVPGFGVIAQHQGDSYYMASSEKWTQQKSVALFKNDSPVFHFILEDLVLESSKTLLRTLQKQKYNIHVLSGDSAQEVSKLTQTLNLPSRNCLASLTAQEKASYISTYKNTVMIGDGVNDSLAFQKADVGIAVSGSVELALRSADIYVLSEDLSQINELFTISKRAVRLVHRNLKISLIYNTLGGLAALMGFINPFVAAVLMPISSGFILLSSWLASRK